MDKATFEDELTEVKSPEAALTGNDVSGSHKTGSDRVRIHNRFLRFFLTIVVVENIPLRMTGSSMATVCAVEEWGSRKRNRKLHNIRHSGAFSPEVTSSNVTRPLRGSLGRVVCTHAEPKAVQYPIKRLP
jgi:hypothetical protein